MSIRSLQQWTAGSEIVTTSIKKQLTLCVDCGQALKNFLGAVFVPGLCCYIPGKLFEDTLKTEDLPDHRCFRQYPRRLPGAPRVRRGANMTQEQITEKRDKILNMADKALARLYAHNPGVRKEIEQAAGYGVFDVTAINAVLLVGSEALA